MMQILVAYYILSILKFCLIMWANKYDWEFHRICWLVIFVPLIGLTYLIIMTQTVMELKKSK